MHNILNIFEFSEYRVYLNVWLAAAKAQRTFNLTRLAEIANIHPTFLSHILLGTKHLSLEQATLISGHLGHTKLEQDYFFVLINLDRAGNQPLKKYWLEKKSQIEFQKNKLSQRFDKHRELTQEQRAEFYSSWIYVAVWVSSSIEKKQSLAQVAERFKITREHAEAILLFLTEVGLCIESDGYYSMNETHVHIPNESFFVTKHHINWRMKAIQKMDTRTTNELFFTAPMSVAKKDFSIIREKITKIIKEIVDTAKDSEAEEVVCLNIDLFTS
ncbi:MAG: TIGR02147 family protein [Bdellovibrionota bacterium]